MGFEKTGSDTRRDVQEAFSVYVLLTTAAGAKRSAILIYAKMYATVLVMAKEHTSGLVCGFCVWAAMTAGDSYDEAAARQSTILYYTVLYYTILCYTILCYTILYHHILHNTILYHTILYYIILYYTILYYTILYYTILYYTILYYTILYYTRLD